MSKRENCRICCDGFQAMRRLRLITKENIQWVLLSSPLLNLLMLLKMLFRFLFPCVLGIRVLTLCCVVVLYVHLLQNLFFFHIRMWYLMRNLRLFCTRRWPRKICLSKEVCFYLLWLRF